MHLRQYSEVLVSLWVMKNFLEEENILSNNKPEIMYCERLGVAMVCMTYIEVHTQMQVSVMF